MRRDFTLFCFGGAAGQHACRVARAAGVRRILVHPLASVLSAFGIGVADRLAVRRASLRRELDEAGPRGRRAPRSRLAGAGARAELAATPAARAAVRVAQLLELRAGDSDVTLSVPLGALGEVRARFHAEHLQRFGFAARCARRVIIEALRAEARFASVDAALAARCPRRRARRGAAAARARLVRRLARGAARAAWLSSRAPLAGPALIVEPHSTVVRGGGLARAPPRRRGAAARG